MVGQNQPDSSLFSLTQQRFELASRLQFNIDVFRARQKSKQQFAALFHREISDPALARMAGGNNQRRTKPRDVFFVGSSDWRKRVETKFEKIGRLSGCKGMAQISLRGDDAHELGPAYFTGSAHCHIIGGSVSGERRVALF